jgi:pyrroloquinoline quinone biosynthesis protein B
MRVRVLGSAAGGGFPQWNCSCPNCRAVRDGSRPCRPRTQSSIAVSADDSRWVLFNASPDLHAQIEACPALWPGRGRVTPLEAVVLTDAELDHTLGLLLLREGQGLEVHATAATRRILCQRTRILATLESYCQVTWRPVLPGAEVAVASGLSYRAFEVPTTKPSRFGTGIAPGRVVGYRITDPAGQAVVYLPGVQELIPAVLAEVADCACLLVDGTCWSDDELTRLGLSRKTARDMGHVPVGGPGGSLELLSPLSLRRTVYVHINNTNPILLDDAPERRIVAERGLEVATDGLEVRV